MDETSEPLAREASFTHWARYVEVPIGESRIVSIEQDPDSFVLGTTVWDSSKTLFKLIERRHEQFRSFTSICELGAGCGGLAGISSAIVTGGLADVVFTDIGPVFPWLRRNVRANLTDKERQRVRVERYAWCGETRLCGLWMHSLIGTVVAMRQDADRCCGAGARQWRG